MGEKSSQKKKERDQQSSTNTQEWCPLGYFRKQWEDFLGDGKMPPTGSQDVDKGPSLPLVAPGTQCIGLKELCKRSCGAPKPWRDALGSNAVCWGISLLTANSNTPLPRAVFPFSSLSSPISIPHFHPRRRQLLSKAASTRHLASNVAISGWTCIPLGLSSHPKVPASYDIRVPPFKRRWNLLLKTLFCKITHKTTTKTTSFSTSPHHPQLHPTRSPPKGKNGKLCSYMGSLTKI